MSKNYDHLYLNILKIGQSKTETGLSYDVLKEELTKMGYDFENDCIELAVKQWFYDSFHHFACNEKYDSWEDLDNHADCNCILKGESCLMLLDYRNSNNSNRAAWIALGLGVLAVLLTIYQSFLVPSQFAKTAVTPRTQIQGFQQGKEINGSNYTPNNDPDSLASDLKSDSLN
jgi:hypothetical protein